MVIQGGISGSGGASGGVLGTGGSNRQRGNYKNF